MTNVFLLTKIQVLGLFGINQLIHTKDSRARLQAALMGAAALIIGAMIVFFSYITAVGYAAIGLVELVPAIILLFFSIITLFFTLIRSSGTLFGFSDYDLIMSLPVHRSSVILSRLLTVYLGNLLFGSLVLLPAMMVFMKESGSPAILWLSALLIWLSAPLLPMIAAMTMGGVITAISVRFRHKNLVITLLSFGATIGTMALSFSMQAVDVDLLADLGLQLGQAIGRFYPPAKINSALFTQHTRTSYRITQLSAATANKALYRREWKLLTSSPVYLLNTCIGPVLMVAAILALRIFGSEQLSSMLQLPGLPGLLQHMTPFFPSLFVVMSSTTAVSLNMEGKNRWILSSLPVSAKEIFDSKILVNLTVLLPPIMFSSLILVMTFPLNYFSILMVFVTPAVYAGFIAVVGLSANLRFLKFDWKSPQQAVKQSMSAMAAMLAGFAAIAPPVALGIVFPEQGQLITVAAVLILAAITALLYRNLRRINIRKVLS